MESRAEILRSRATARGWTTPDGGDTWVATSSGKNSRAAVRAVSGGFEASVWRQQSSPFSKPDRAPLEGPQIFESCEDALDYAEANLGSERPTRRPGSAH